MEFKSKKDKLLYYMLIAIVCFNVGAISYNLMTDTITGVNIDADNEIVIDKSEIISGKCKATYGNRLCEINEVKKLFHEYEHINKPPIVRGIQKASETISAGKGNCLDKSIMGAAVLKNLGFDDIYFVHQKGIYMEEPADHMCLLVGSEGDYRFIYCIEELDIIEVRKIE